MFNKKIFIIALIFGLTVSTANYLINRAAAEVGSSLNELNLNNEANADLPAATAETVTEETTVSPTAEPTSDTASTISANKHEIAYWWGKVNQHTENGLWTTDPDGVAGANINRYTYCKKWYDTTLYAISDDREFITDWRNAGNSGSFDMEAQTYQCTNNNVVSDYQAQNKLFRNDQAVELTLSDGQTIKVNITASALRSDFDTCGDTRILFEINDQYASRYLCVNESDHVNLQNGLVKVALKKIINGAGNTYAVAEITPTNETNEATEELPLITEETPTIFSSEQDKQDKIRSVFQHVKDIKLFSTPKITAKAVEIVTQSGQEFLLYLIRGDYFGETGDVKIGNRWLEKSEVLFRSEHLIIALVDPSVTGEVVVSRLRHAADLMDTDRDGLPDKWEQILGTDATQPDSDGDGYTDGMEVENKYDPLHGRRQQYNEVDVSDL